MTNEQDTPRLDKQTVEKELNRFANLHFVHETGKTNESLRTNILRMRDLAGMTTDRAAAAEMLKAADILATANQKVQRIVQGF